MSRNFQQSSVVMAARLGIVAFAAIIGLTFAGCSDTPGNQAVKSVANLGGRVGRDSTDPNSTTIEANLAGTRMTDEELKALAPLKEIRKLDLSSTKVTDAGLKELAGFKLLEYLDLTSTDVSDAGMKDLAGLENLNTLILSHTKVSNTGIVQLASLKKLQKLDLFGTVVTESGVAALKRSLPACKINR